MKSSVILGVCLFIFAAVVSWGVVAQQSPGQQSPAQLPSTVFKKVPFEVKRQCATGDPNDCDGDGHAPVSRGGGDCDDYDPRRYPGNSEVGDPDHVDEDCNPMTYGAPDRDLDGWEDSRFCNYQPDGSLDCGMDCDDTTSSINPTALEDPLNGYDDNCNGVIDEGKDDYVRMLRRLLETTPR